VPYDHGVRDRRDFGPGVTRKERGAMVTPLVVQKNGFTNSRDRKRGRTWEWGYNR
jgi:hypothetical protein